MFDLHFCVPPIPANPTSIVILLHGYGSNGDNMRDIAEFWQPQLPNTIFYSPNALAPFPQIRDGYQWFTLEDYHPLALQRESWTAYPKLLQHIRQAQRYFNIPWNKTALVGFSQGCMMALGVSLFDQKVCGTIVGYSGGLYYKTQDIQALPKDLKVLLIHGTSDTVVPVSASQDAQAFLQKAGFNCELALEPGLEHSISYEGLQKGSKFLEDAL